MIRKTQSSKDTLNIHRTSRAHFSMEKLEQNGVISVEVDNSSISLVEVNLEGEQSKDSNFKKMTFGIIQFQAGGGLAIHSSFGGNEDKRYGMSVVESLAQIMHSVLTQEEKDTVCNLIQNGAEN